MGQDPSQIREEIEEARDHMSETVEALGSKADVKSRAKEAVAERRDHLKDKVSGLTGRASDATPDVDQVKAGAHQAVGIAQENPIGLAIGGVAAGFLAGMLIPSTRIENERVGPVADQLKETARETGQEALERGKEVAKEAASTAKETARDQAQELASSAQENAQQSAQQAREQVAG
jgi:gas vesicle protein